MDKLHSFIVGFDPLSLWLAAFLVSGLAAGIFTGYLRARKIQPNGFRWRIFRNEIFFAVVNVAASGVLIGGTTTFLREHGFITFNTAPASWWVIAAEFALYFFAFDTYFYWLHRLMHIEPVYTWVHKIHHRSISPNPLTTLSVNPLESLINGGFVPLFTAALTLHNETMLLIAPFNIIMGLYVHSGFEFFPKWWNRSWATKWFITATFHDQHHRYFKGNYGGYTTIWDRICGTVRPTFETDFAKVTSRPIKPLRLATKPKGPVEA
ncbi:sterol desaturase family protein [Phenylobacterium sp. LjRoot219]|uniref:sterol desaturase family protein n=1 Tax=Phenylobacterium sp. LjRoot219 TaxID=3342283 RepID=UPI003ECE6845